VSHKHGQYQIIATLGPAAKNMVRELIHAGATGFRLNCSHLTLEELSRWLIELEQAFQKRGNAMPVWLDVQGSKLRIGRLTQVMILQRGDRLTFRNSYSQAAREIPLPHASVFQMIRPEDKILLDDGKINLEVRSVYNGTFDVEIINFGELSSFKGFVLKNNDTELAQVSPRDQQLIEQTRHWKFVGYAISYLQSVKEFQLFRDVAKGRPLVAKIERQKVFAQLREIAEAADLTWLCRGDLGTDGSIYQLFQYEKKFIDHMTFMTKPSLIAGQVLENMVLNNYPSRSEIAHLGFLIENGFSGIVLSDETAIGNYPIEAVEFCRNYFDYIRK
jgi:pyruvate kinase